MTNIAYHVLPQGQSTRTILSATGTGFTRVREVMFQVDSGPGRGTTDSVQVPEDIATVDVIRRAIEEKIEHIAAVSALGVQAEEGS